jgi:Raf kinase inhibitor-like YbhB/YbcL family protein
VYTQDGVNRSPPIEWHDLPEGTRELALIVEDPDAPRAEPFVHWLCYKIHPEIGRLPEGLPHKPEPKVPGVERQGRNDYDHIGYDGPAPPPGHGVHHYHFRLYALNKSLEAEPKLNVKALIATMAGHEIETAELVGTYER